MSKCLLSRVTISLLIISLISSMLAPSLVLALGGETRVLLCTSKGYQWVTVEVDSEPKSSEEVNQQEHCWYCSNANEDPEQRSFGNKQPTFVFLRHFSSSVNVADEANRNILANRHPRAPPI